MADKGRRYDPEFIRQALRLTRESGKTKAQIARDLGVSLESLRRWRILEEINAGTRSEGAGFTSPYDEEIKRLKRELRVSCEEREILKKAVAFFAREENRGR